MAFPPRFNQFPPFMGVPPMSHPPPMLDPAELIMRQKAQMYGQGLERVTNVAELIEFSTYHLFFKCIYSKYKKFSVETRL